MQKCFSTITNVIILQNLEDMLITILRYLFSKRLKTNIMCDEILQELREIKELLSLDTQVLSLNQFCKLADISIHHARYLTSNLKIRFFRPTGKLIYIDKEDAYAFLRQNPVEPLSEIIKKSDKLL